MPRTQKQRRAVPRRRPARVPRAVSNGTVAVLRRTFAAGNVARLAVDGGAQWGTVPSNLSDWSSLQGLFARYRLLRVVNHYVTNGEYDSSPAYATFWVYHDFMSVGAPTSLQDAFLKQGVRALRFSASQTKRSFSYVPMVWASSGFSTQLPAPQMHYQTATSFAPTFSSLAGWLQNYNTTIASPPVLLVQEMVIEFSEPV